MTLRPTPTWKYRCSICKELVALDDMTEHMEMEKAKPDWPGILTWDRVDEEPRMADPKTSGPDPMPRCSVCRGPREGGCLCEDYEALRDAVIEAFNPADDDAAEPAIMAEAVERAATFIQATDCHCDDPHPVEDGTLADWEGACARCQVLGRVQDQVESR